MNAGLPKPIWSSEQVASLDVHKILLVLTIKTLRVDELEGILREFAIAHR